ncbi:MAG: ribonuclease H-like YkuK family protein [Patescibacteria group bacterium]|nr:ribonuclease H-like YkuK family protein [Patescibacteria group bacterium]
MKRADKSNGFLTVFHSPTLGEMGIFDVVQNVLTFTKEDKNSHYRIIIGTDSQAFDKHFADFVSAVVVHRVGRGGVYFWTRGCRDHIQTLRQRMWEEANYSLLVAQKLISEFEAQKLSPLQLEIHVDIGANGDTREMINEIVGMIRGNGFECKTKPDAFGASNVADRYT